MAVFDYRKRLLPLVYTAPSGATFKLGYDKLDREGGKKSSTNEILDSNSSVTQDQGNQVQKLPMDVYFTGDNYDLLADGFFTALSEKYTISDPGILTHPRWGVISVFPVKWKQSESFVSGQRRANFTVEFVRIYPYGGLFATVGLVISQILGLISLLESLDLEAFIKSTVQSVQAIGVSIKASINTIKKSVTKLINTHIDVRDKSNNIYLESQSLLNDPGTNADLLVGQAQTLLKIPMEFEDDTFTKINSYHDIVQQTIIDNANAGDIQAEVKKNKAIILERITGYAVAAQCGGALSTNFKTRAEAISGIQKLEETYDMFKTALENSKVNSTIENSFSGDYKFLDILHEIYSKTTALILQDSFSLSAEKSIVLSEPSDIITLCYKYYKTISNEKINFFIETNSIKNSEFVEIPAGREIVFYVE